ncbi:ankyrin repeat-containing domain-containingprotein [Purpureocillium lavendulum]|uniref:Ankyrin repeat-containing domain-containingprotein n=1 Tax=Purpureocillium lavendulum TaxID=1247861 RepID=A0AB34FR89_9HYPO|nr:ankyrin repeat-containing domain-containingprotein [Purpureocillium lavendulum]
MANSGSRREYETFAASQVTDAMLEEAAALFSENYGTWGAKSEHQGKPVTMTAHRLRDEFLPAGAAASYTRVKVDGQAAGHALACRWKHGGQTVCWITQLVVGTRFRTHGLARGLLTTLREHGDDVYGLASSNPVECLAAASSFGSHIQLLSLDYIKQNAAAVMKASPIPYVRDAKLCGSLFGKDMGGCVSAIDSQFFIDHTEPLQALKDIKQHWEWPLGDLPEGCEYLVVMPSTRLRRT